MRWRTKLLAPLVVLAPALLAAPPAQSATQTVAIWHMDSAPMIDSSGNGHDGILTDVTVVPGGVSGNAYAFQQSDSSVTVPDSGSFNPGTSDFSFTAHVNFTAVPDAATVGDYDLIRKGLAGTSGGEWKMEIVPNADTGAANAFCLFKDDAGHSDSVRGSQNLADGTWHTVTCGRTSTTIQLVVDGSPTTATPPTPLGNISSNAAVVIGQKWRGGDQYTGLLDEVSFDLGAPGSRDGDDDDDRVAPTFMSATPASNATGVGRATTVTATFSEPVHNVGSGTFTLTSSAGAAVAAAYSANAAGTEWTLDPTADLAPNTWYTLTLTKGIADAAGNSLASGPVTWHFRTGSEPPASAEGPAASGTGSTAKVAVLWTLGGVLLIGAGLALAVAIHRAGGRRHWY